MTNQEKLNILENMLQKHGLSIHSGPFCELFYKNRNLSPLTDAEEETLTYSSLVRPTMMEILPSDVENASYGSWHNTRTLEDWLLYANSGDNPLVFENLESEPESLIESFKNVKRDENAMRVDPTGKIFNGNDGNHRLLTLILKHAAERMSAKTDAERLAVDERYKMKVPVSYPISRELASLLRREQADGNTQSIYPKLALQFREQAFYFARERDYSVGYNPETQEYNYSYNGVKFNGTEEQLIQFLNTKEASSEPIMTFCCGGVYYISCNNKIWKTRDKEKANKLIANIRQGYKDEKFPPKQYLEVKDCDASEKEYSVLFPELFLPQEEREKAQQIATKLLHLIKQPQAAILGDKILNRIREECEKTDYWGSLNLDEIQLDGLSKEEYLQISQLFDQMEALIFPEDADYKE